MALNPPISAVQNLPRGILLVEEYSALAVAISSALRKFAPLHAVEVVHNFAEADRAAATMRPELFVLDLDPPPSGEIEFFNELKANHPEARVLVIAAGTAREVRAMRGTAGALQFIEKPFDLAEFGAAVQALLGPWAAPSPAGLRGTIRNLHILDIVELKCLAGSTAIVQVQAAGNKAGEIHFQKGQISHAITGALTGLAALEEIAGWPEARLSEMELPVESPRTIDANWQAVLLQLVRKLSETSRPNSLGPTPPPLPPAKKTGKKILVVDDTEMLLIFVADVLATTDQNFLILTASSGGEGLRLAASEQPDLLLLDYCLTDMTGDKVCQALLENPGTARIPVLLMSGHLIELARTAEDYENVVAALPKPFLSGALISTVEKVLGAGPLPEPAVGGAAGTPRPAPALRAESAALLPNGQEAKVTSDIKPPPVSAPSGPGAGAFVRPTTLDVTLTLEVVALQFTSSLQLDTATLRPVDRFVAVKKTRQEEPSAERVEYEFECEKITLDGTGQIETMRLTPTRKPPQPPFLSRSFPVGSGGRVQPAKTDPNLPPAPPAEEVMRVRLSAQFELIEVELSIGFEVVAILVKARSAPVLIRNNVEDFGRAFELTEVRLGSANELDRLLVRAVA